MVTGMHQRSQAAFTIACGQASAFQVLRFAFHRGSTVIETGSGPGRESRLESRWYSHPSWQGELDSSVTSHLSGPGHLRCTTGQSMEGPKCTPPVNSAGGFPARLMSSFQSAQEAPRACLHRFNSNPHQVAAYGGIQGRHCHDTEHGGSHSCGSHPFSPQQMLRHIRECLDAAFSVTLFSNHLPLTTSFVIVVHADNPLVQF